MRIQVENLESIRRKVEAGEALSEDELRSLEQAVQAQPGPVLNLTVAHALSNAGEDLRALDLLDRLCREHPTDPQMQLGRARALTGLERYGEAEGALRLALALNPKDPEALKSMGLLALRRGETRRAEALIAQVLEVDPLDAEARLVQEELHAAELPSPPPLKVALRPEFLLALREHLAQRGLVTEEQAGNVVLQTAEGIIRVSADSLYSGYLAEGADLQRAVEQMARQLMEQARFPATAEVLLERARPVLRPASFAASAVGAAWREGPAGLGIFYVVDDPELVRYVPSSVLERLGISAQTLDEAAWRELDGRPVAPRPATLDGGTARLVQSASGLWAVCAGDGYDGARLLCASQRALLVEHVGAGPYVVSLAQREYALVCRSTDAEALRLGSARCAPDGVPGVLVLSAEGALAMGG